jgi:hypothetical protein
MMHEIAPIERQVMQMLLAGEHLILEILRQQFARSIVAERDFTGVGFFTSFKVQDCLPRLVPPRRIVIGEVSADVDGLGYGCGFILFVADGLLGTLECQLWGDDAFPENPQYTRLYYVHQPNPPAVVETRERDMDALNATLAK